MYDDDETQWMPQHVGIIMDGNGRWAKHRGLLRTFGHKAGVKAVRAAVSFARKNNIPSLTLFAFSSENWQRPADEVSLLMTLFKRVLVSEIKKLHKNGVKLNIIGDRSRFDSTLNDKIDNALNLTQYNSDLVLNIAANYGGRWDITQATKAVCQKVIDGELKVDDIDEDSLNIHTCLADLPELDLLIRTGGEHRISNFLLWQAAYAELYFTDTYWPDFDEGAFALAINDFKQRQRRFGKTGDQVA
jgi:undecaprenyl diphosphate synthase